MGQKIKDCLIQIAGELSTSLEQMLGVPTKFDASALGKESNDTVKEKLGEKCVQALTILPTSEPQGLGFLFPLPCAIVIAQKALMLPAGEKTEDSLVPAMRDALQEVFNVLVGSWNKAAPKSMAISPQVSDFTVGEVELDTLFSSVEGKEHAFLLLEFHLENQSYPIAFLSPWGALDVEAAMKEEEEKNEESTKEGGEDPESSPQNEETAQSGDTSPAARKDVEKVVFIDRSGALIQWLRTQFHNHQFSFTENTPDEEALSEAGVAIVLEINPTDLVSLSPQKIVIMEKEG